MHELEHTPRISVSTPVESISNGLSWVQVAKDAPYFVTEDGAAWFPIGQNDSITWPQMAGIYGRREMASAERYFAYLANHGVTCLRLMLEYGEGGNRYFEDPAGHFDLQMVRAWDDVFALCERYGLRILLTPFDSFWTWIRWEYHPYNAVNGGPCEDRTHLMVSQEVREFIKRRLAFASERWGGSGVLFAWDLWNEIHPAFAADNAEYFADFVEEVGSYLRNFELERFGRAHLQTVSVFGPLITEGFQPQSFTVFAPVMAQDPRIADCIFRNISLDLASAHLYEEGTIDDPKNTVDAALSVGELVRESLGQIRDNRPFVDSEYGPIHTYKDCHITLPETFDDEYFRHVQWAHIASGEASGGMRWPNRRPHQLTDGMRDAQAALARFVPYVDWANLSRRNWNQEIKIESPALRGVACGDARQALIWMVRADSIGANGILRHDVEPIAARICLPEMEQGQYRILAWDTVAGAIHSQQLVDHSTRGPLEFQTPEIRTDLAFYVQRTNASGPT